MSTTERASIAGRAAQAKLTPDQRRESMSKARLSAAVNAVVSRAPELNASQLARLRAIFSE